MKGKVFTVHHRMPEHYVASETFVPFLTGVALGGHPDILTDEAGISIAQKHSYCEMRAQYHVWKNRPADFDYVGFQHYRRWFLFPWMLKSARIPGLRRPLVLYLRYHPIVSIAQIDAAAFRSYLAFLKGLDDQEVARLWERLAQFDLIVPRPLRFGGATLRTQYGRTHASGDWNALEHALARIARFRDSAGTRAVDLRALYACNIYIMRAEIFGDYMQFWHEVTQRLEKTLVISQDPYQSRVFGFLSERIFTIYLHHLRLERPTLRVLELPLLLARS